ncbi:hypothetical protein FHP29_08750 [Nocardioides albidus]|uniref:Uncharacterized protein n=1 Tax=Nocardioides albidus TaxID=1517589 RepID=A0A5C4VYR4_9ACTN|nr:rhamnan synthesis F family protein [Nocardioides albidus]TNM41097.1 hypothetical protein FHP29_08750 [Nocardioides albidus]
MTPAQFIHAWHALVARWEALASEDRKAADALLADTVRSGLHPHPGEELATPDAETLLACEIAVVRRARAMKGARYARAHRDLKVLRDGDIDPVEHFCRVGWRWLRSPRRDFDVWWYWSQYLDPERDDINPLLFHVLVGRHAGHRTSPPQVSPRPGALPPSPAPRRICLYAAYDADGIVDDYVLHYLRELSRHADVYYLADGVMARTELAKLADVTVAAWSIPHGRYDFGSFSMLATELVGWDTIDGYDELLFANDSCYLLRSLDEAFARMDARPADWWGLQATKMDFSRSEGHLAPVPLARAKTLHTELEDWNPHYRMHLSSYLLAFRPPVFRDPGFRRRLGAVVKQAHKELVILKYEIGLSDYLVKAGFDFATFIDDLYPFHPLYSSDYFELLDRGFPLLKRNFIGEYPGTPDLGRWRERVLEHVPDARVDLIEPNLRRVAPADKLVRTHRISTGPDGRVDYQRRLNKKEFRVEDRVAPRFDHWWAFPVSTPEHVLTGNERAIFEEVRDDPSIKKIVLTRSRAVAPEGANVVSVPLDSRAGQEHLARAGQVFVRHSAELTLPWELDMDQHRVIDVGAGLPRPAHALDAREALSSSPQRRGRRAERHVLVATGSADSMPADAREDGAREDGAPSLELWATGQPRHAFLLRAEEDLPADLRAELAGLRAELAGRRLALWLPAAGRCLPDLDDAGLDALAAWARRNDTVIGVRSNAEAHRLAGLDPLLLMPRRLPHVEVLYRAADVLVSDNSHHLAEFLLTGRPVVVLGGADGEQDLPGPACDSGADLVASLERALGVRSEDDLERYARCRERLVGHADDGAARRVVQQVRRASLSDPAPPPAVRAPRERRPARR